jgi:hypothetical protein
MPMRTSSPLVKPSGGPHRTSRRCQATPLPKMIVRRFSCSPISAISKMEDCSRAAAGRWEYAVGKRPDGRNTTEAGCDSGRTLRLAFVSRSVAVRWTRSTSDQRNNRAAPVRQPVRTRKRAAAIAGDHISAAKPCAMRCAARAFHRQSGRHVRGDVRETGAHLRGVS